MTVETQASYGEPTTVLRVLPSQVQRFHHNTFCKVSRRWEFKASILIAKSFATALIPVLTGILPASLKRHVIDAAFCNQNLRLLPSGSGSQSAESGTVT